MMIDVKNDFQMKSRTVPVRTGARRPGSPGGFTLIELMISIALVVILILGVSQVFQYTTQAVGAGEAITAAIRNGRSVQGAFDQDFAAMVGYGTGVNDAPCMIISSRAAYAYRNAKDQASQGTLASSATALPPAAYRDLSGSGTSGDPTVNGDVVLPDNYNYRNHRLDTLSFFARNEYARQTGNPGVFVANQASTEAWIWYGHLWLPDNMGAYNTTTYAAGGAYPSGATGPITFPGAGTASTNPNNYYASQFVLGRQAILMQQPDAVTGSVKDRSGVAQWFVGISTNPSINFPPLSETSQLTTPVTAAGDVGPYYLPDSRVDIMNSTLSSFGSYFNSWLNYTSSPGVYAHLYSYSASPWADYMMNGSIDGGTITGVTAYPRFKCNPYLAKPMTAKNMAQASPYLIGGCSQFIVEFAGDFLKQDNNPQDTIRVEGAGGHPRYGDVLGVPIARGVGGVPLNATNVGQDGQLDFFINSSGVKQTIWYGMPRNTSGQSKTCAFDPTVMTNDGAPPNNAYGDVVPLRDWLQYVYNTATNTLVTPASTPPGETNATFEKNFPPATESADYNAMLTLADAQNGYTCAWSSLDTITAHPKIMLIRITMTLEDPTGRLPDGQTFQYVFPVTPTPSSN